jgi:hypothetical protein
MPKMNPEIKEKWLNDLRSGEYKKGKGLLRNGTINNGETFCCLGVLCDRYRKETGQGAWEAFHGFIDSEGNPNITSLPEEVRVWAGLLDFGHAVYIPERVTSLATMNDRTDTFDAVIKLIEENL